MNLAPFFIGMSIIIGSSFGEDLKVKEKVFLSQFNQIQSVHLELIGTVRYSVFRFKRKLDSKFSKGKGTGEASNFGDSASTYCYKRELDMSEFEKQLLPDWIRNEKLIDFTYSCGDVSEDEKRKSFLGFAETNCQCLDFTFENEVKTPWQRKW